MPQTGPVWTKKGLPIGEPLGAAAVSCSLAPAAALPNDAAAEGGAVATFGIAAPPAPNSDAILAPPANLWFGNTWSNKRFGEKKDKLIKTKRSGGKGIESLRNWGTENSIMI